MHNPLREVVPVRLVDHTKTAVELLLDTGAIATLLPMHLFLELERFPVCGKETEISGLGGYKVFTVPRRVDRMYIRGMCVGTQRIWTTHDENVQDAVLGMDILCQLDIAYRADTRTFTYRRGVYQPNSIIDYFNYRYALYTYLESIMRTYKYDDLLTRFKPSFRTTYTQFVMYVNQLLQQ